MCVCVGRYIYIYIYISERNGKAVFKCRTCSIIVYSDAGFAGYEVNIINGVSLVTCSEAELVNPPHGEN